MDPNPTGQPVSVPVAEPGPRPPEKDCEGESYPEPAEDQLSASIRRAINLCSAENASNTPDFILAEFILGCLRAFNTASRARERWYGRGDRPGRLGLQEPPAEPPAKPLGLGVLVRTYPGGAWEPFIVDPFAPLDESKRGITWRWPSDPAPQETAPVELPSRDPGAYVARVAQELADDRAAHCRALLQLFLETCPGATPGNIELVEEHVGGGRIVFHVRKRPGLDLMGTVPPGQRRVVMKKTYGY
jgi:hypothetical protein